MASRFELRPRRGSRYVREFASPRRHGSLTSENGTMGAIDLPSNVRAAVDTTANIGAWWAVAGGWAIDMWLGRQTRDHHDIEVAVLRDDRIVIWEQLHDRFELTCIDPPDSGWRAWGPDELVAGPAFQGQACGPDATFDLFFETASDGRWIFRR